MEIGKTLITVRNMVDSFISLNALNYERFLEKYEKENGHEYYGPKSLSLQSYIGSDLTIDLCYLAKDLEERESFTNEYWIRSQGIQCIRDEEDRKANESVWHNVLGKFKVTKTKSGEVIFEWIQDEMCIIKNQLIEDKKLYVKW